MRAAFMTVAAALALCAGVAAADKSYTASATHDCGREPDVSINSSNGTFKFTGTCTKISVNGGSNKLVVEAVKKIALNGSKNTADVGATDKISVNGSENVVTYKKGLSSDKPAIGGVGAKNSVTQK